jgi:hypothetical protein
MRKLARTSQVWLYQLSEFYPKHTSLLHGQHVNTRLVVPGSLDHHQWADVVIHKQSISRKRSHQQMMGEVALTEVNFRVVEIINVVAFKLPWYTLLKKAINKFEKQSTIKPHIESNAASMRSDLWFSCWIHKPFTCKCHGIFGLWFKHCGKELLIHEQQIHIECLPAFMKRLTSAWISGWWKR